MRNPSLFSILFTLSLLFLSPLYGWSQCDIVYVTPAGSGDGTINNPTNLEDAINAMTVGTHLKLSLGTHFINHTAINLPSGFVIEGGFLPDQNWKKTNHVSGTTRIYRNFFVYDGPREFPRLTAFQLEDISGFKFLDLTILIYGYQNSNVLNIASTGMATFLSLSSMSVS